MVDNKKYKELGGDLKAVRRRTKDIASIVNSVRTNITRGFYENDLKIERNFENVK